MSGAYIYRVPPGWPTPPNGWEPPEGWMPSPEWPPAPQGWQFWVLGGSSELADNDLRVGSQTSHMVPDVIQSSVTSSELEELREQLEASRGELADARLEVEQIRAREADQTALRQASASDLVDLNDQRVLQDVGLYAYRHPAQNSEEYRDRLKGLTDRIKSAIRDGRGVVVSDMFTFGGSLAKGRKMTSDISKLMLRAYNAEADNAMRAMRAGNSVTAIKRLEAAAESIARLGSIMEMHIDPSFHDLRVEEIMLTQDYLMKVQEEKECARDERDRLREERKAELELRAERERLDKERAHYMNVLASLRESGDEEGASSLEQKITDLDQAIAQNDYRTANIRAGYVYVISNVGAFGPNIVKIGMTRRLEPMDRVRELGDASVPFPFDVHALYFSNDAVTLETELHQAFSESKVNHVNPRREFFFATPDQVRIVLANKVGNLLEFTEDPEATQYFQSRKYWPKL